MKGETKLGDAVARMLAAQEAARSVVRHEDAHDLTVTEVALSWLHFFWSWRSVFVRATLTALVMGSAAALLIPAKYTARATILPPENSGSNLSRLLSALPMAAAQMLGSTGDSKMVELYVDIAKSDAVLADVLNADYGGHTFRDALRAGADKQDWQIIEDLQQSFAGSKHPRTQLVMFELTRHDPKLAAATLNQIIKEMERFFQYRMATTENLERKMIEKRLGEVRDSLHLAENVLRQFKESNRSTLLSPNLTLQEGRLMRDVEINNAIYVELTKQLELAKINEAESMPVLNVLDYAAPPQKRSGPSRAMILLTAFGAGACAAFLHLRFREHLPERLRRSLDFTLGLNARVEHD